MQDLRPNPENLLKQAQEEELHERRGKLKIYLGAAPGVGKTYSMLEDALIKRENGLDVVVGIVESHGRKEIKTLLNNFEVLPRQKVVYRDRELHEFDLDTALKRNPGLILIDEMAHTNVPGLRHTKRWQDIKELLDRGIDVYTTLNIQHIESLNDIIAKIIHIHIKETVPDSILESADSVELVDLTPDELLKRLHEGKVYFPAQAELAQDNFFKPSNLTALRELALRTTAELIKSQFLLYRQGDQIKKIVSIKEKILVCIGPGMEALKLIRAGKRLATALHAEWIVLHVDSAKLHYTEAERNKAIQYLHFAEHLGAKTQILSGYDIAKEILNFAREQNISVIIIWKKIRSWLRDLVSCSLADEIVRLSGEINVYIITPDITDAILTKTHPEQKEHKSKKSWKYCLISASTIIIATVINYFLFPYVEPSNLMMIYLLAVTIVALCGRIIPAILASILSVLLFDYFFVPPFYSFNFPDIATALTIIIMLLVSIMISHLTVISRKQALSAQYAQKHTAALHNFSYQLASTRGIDKLLKTASDYLGEIFDSHVLILLPKKNDLYIHSSFGEAKDLNEKEKSIAQWVFDIGQIAGLGTDTLSYSDSLYLPLISTHGSVGVLRIKPYNIKTLFSPEQMRLLESYANQIALALEADRIESSMITNELKLESERVHGLLLRTISQNLRTPLIAALGSVNTLREQADRLEKKEIKHLEDKIQFELEELNRIINNILLITTLESETFQLKKELCELKNILSSACEALHEKIRNYDIKIDIERKLPKINADKTLVEEVFIHLIENAAKFSPEDKAIEVSAYLGKNNITISILDYGPGIVTDEIDKLFEKFYRGRKITTERGLGLGLAICQKIVLAHNGRIWAENHKEGGAIFFFTLPI